MYEITQQPQGEWHQDLWSDGTQTLHAKEGTVFFRAKYEGTIYYLNADDYPGQFEDIKAGLLGTETSAFHHALVRRQGRADGFFTGYAYYPLPLIFATPEERELAANVINQRPPAERWARRRREEIEKHFNLPVKESNHE
jgi:hypothetical protein